MRILRYVGYAVLTLAVLAVAGLVAVYFINPFAPPVAMSDPAPSGRRVTEQGLVANYFPPPSPGRHPAVLVLGGSEGGLGGGGQRIALALQKEGYAVFQLAYFRAPGQSDTLELIALELFDRALAWLKAQPEVDAERIALVGGSKGAEAALLVATRHPELRAVVAGMPSSVAWQGIDWNFMNYIIDPPDGSWSLAGKPIPFVPYVQEYTQSLLELYTKSLAQVSRHPAAVIPIEQSKAAILLICGNADQLWPSCAMADQLKARADKNGAPAVTILAYPDAGHAVFGVPVEKTNPNYDRLDSMGGTDDGNNAARTDAWPKTLQHLRAAFGTATAPPTPP
jgi:dienelactone hydrolase